MTHFITISDQNRGEPFALFSGETLDAAFLSAAAHLGGHAAIDAGHIEDREAGQHIVYVRDVDPVPFWYCVMAQLFDGLDNQDWFVGEDRAEVEAKAIAFHGGNTDGGE